MLTVAKGLAPEAIKRGIRVNAVAPGSLSGRPADQHLLEER